MCIRKQHPARRQAVDVGRPRLGMPTQATDPVIQVIHGDEQDVGLLRSLGPGCYEGREREEKRELDDSSDVACLRDCGRVSIQRPIWVRVRSTSPNRAGASSLVMDSRNLPFSSTVHLRRRYVPCS